MSRSTEVQTSDIEYDYGHRRHSSVLETGAQSVTDLTQRHQTQQHLVIGKTSLHTS